LAARHRAWRPIVAALGASGTLLVSALATIALGLLTVAVLARARKRTPLYQRMPSRGIPSALLHVVWVASARGMEIERDDSEVPEKVRAEISENADAEWVT